MHRKKHSAFFGPAAPTSEVADGQRGVCCLTREAASRICKDIPAVTVHGELKLAKSMANSMTTLKNLDQMLSARQKRVINNEQKRT